MQGSFTRENQQKRFLGSNIARKIELCTRIKHDTNTDLRNFATTEVLLFFLSSEIPSVMYGGLGSLGISVHCWPRHDVYFEEE